MRVVVMGSEGQLGIALARAKPDYVTLIGVSHSTCDVTIPAAVDRCFEEQRPDLVFNFAAFTAVDLAETERQLAQAVNTNGAAHVATAAQRVGARVIYVSTDYVFDGSSSVPYPPEAVANPLNFYGRTKLDGEVATLAHNAYALVIRSSWLYSLAGKNFLSRALSATADAQPMRVVNDQRGTPTAAKDFADVLWRCAERPDLKGTFHFSDAGDATWYEFAREIQRAAAEAGFRLNGAQVIPISSEEYAAPARRPLYSVLDSSSLVRALRLRQRSWQSALRDVLRERVQQQSIATDGI